MRCWRCELPLFAARRCADEDLAVLMRRAPTAVLSIAVAWVGWCAAADAAFTVPDSFTVASARGPRPPSAAVNESGASLTAYLVDGAVQVRERSAAGVLSAPQSLPLGGEAFSATAALDDAGNALVGVDTAAGPMAFVRPAGGTFGPAQQLGGRETGISSLAMDGAGNAAAVLTEYLAVNTTRLLLRLRPAAGVFARATVLSRGDAGAQLAFDGAGGLAVAVVDQPASQFQSGRRLAVRTGTVAGGVGKELVLARTRGQERIDSAHPAIDAQGRVQVAYDLSRDTVRSPFRSVRLATVTQGGTSSRTRVLARGGAYDSQIATRAGRTAVAWASISPTQAGISVSLCTASGRCERSQRVSAPERGFSLSTDRSRPVAGATEARSSQPLLRVSRRGDVGVVWLSSPDFGPATALAAIRARGATRFDGPDPVSPLGSDATPGQPVWTTNGALLAPFRSGTTIALAQRAGPAAVPRPKDRSAPKLKLTTPTAADLNAGTLTSRVSCSEPCAIVSRAVIVVGNDIAKPTNDEPELAAPGRPVVISLPLQRTQRPKLTAGQRPVRGRLRVSVVDRLGNATTGETQVCIPRRRDC